jgi:hypothetical protein
MTSILFVGQKPETVDFTDSSLPPGLNADQINGASPSRLKESESAGGRATPA